MLVGVVAQSLKPVKLLATCKRTQQLPTMLGVVRPQCCVRWHGALLSHKLTLPADGRVHFQGQRVRSWFCFYALVSGHPEWYFVRLWIIFSNTFVAINFYQFQSLFFHVHVRFHFKTPLEFYPCVWITTSPWQQCQILTNGFFFAFQTYICCRVSSR